MNGAHPDGPRPVVLVLADLSGYTRFMTRHDDKSLRHSQMIVGELLETLLRQVDVPLQVSSVEGDALFLYAEKPDDPEVWRRRSHTMVERLLAMFRHFHDRLVEIGAYSVCKCEACASVGNLGLKIIVHTGEALLTSVGPYPTLSGVDVITLHRLAKNSVDEDRYVLLTEPAFAEIGVPDGVEVRRAVERYDTGEIPVRYFVPPLGPDPDPDAIRAQFSDANVAVRILRDEVSREYSDVAADPGRGFHFNTGRAAAELMGYKRDWLAPVPEYALASFAGTGNPFSLGELRPGDYVVDVGSGAGVDSLIAAGMVGAEGHVIGVEMTGAMLTKARSAAETLGLEQLEFREGYMESLPVPDSWADVVISNGAVNLSPLKARVYEEMFRVVRPGGRIQIADITVETPIPEEAKRDIDLWTN